jgi:hypothetical protein
MKPADGRLELLELGVLWSGNIGAATPPPSLADTHDAVRRVPASSQRANRSAADVGGHWSEQLSELVQETRP